MADEQPKGFNLTGDAVPAEPIEIPIPEKTKKKKSKKKSKKAKK